MGIKKVTEKRSLISQKKKGKAKLMKRCPEEEKYPKR